MDKILTVSFNKDNKKTSSNCALYLGNRAQNNPWIQHNVRMPWDLIPENTMKGCNFFVTLNPDPNMDWYTNDTDKKTIITKFLKTIQELKDLNIINKCVFIYEYGKYGKKHGKLHFHGFIKTTQKQEFEKRIYQVFNDRSNLKHRTLNLKNIKSVKDRDQMTNYLKKEPQNKLKCLYFN